MFSTVVTITGDETVSVPFAEGRICTKANIVQLTGSNVGSNTIKVRLPGDTGYHNLDSSANSMDLTAANVIHKIGANGDQVMTGISMTTSGASGAMTFLVIAFGSIGL